MTQAAGPVPRDGGVIDARWAVSGLFIANGVRMGSWAPMFLRTQRTISGPVVSGRCQSTISRSKVSRRISR